MFERFVNNYDFQTETFFQVEIFSQDSEVERAWAIFFDEKDHEFSFADFLGKKLI